MKYEIDHDHEGEGNPYFYVFISSQALINQAVNSRTFHNDATYKQLYMSKFPTFYPCHSDANGKGFPCGIVVAANERSRTFSNTMQACRDLPTTVGLYTNLDSVTGKITWQPELHMADGSKSISKAGRQEYPTKKRGMCFPHVQRNYRKKLLQINDPKKRLKVDNQIKDLQLARNTPEFESACACVFGEWMNDADIKPFAVYFIPTWGRDSGLSGFFEGYDPRGPSSNNCDEAIHKWVKKHHFKNMQYNLHNFLKKGLDVVNYWSHIALHGHPSRHPQVQPTMTLKVETDAYKWFRSRPTFFPIGTHMLPEGLGDVYLVLPDPCPEQLKQLAPDALQAQLEKYAFPALPFSSFAEFRQCTFSVWIVFNPQGSLWWTCTCPPWTKEKICKHVVGIKAKVVLMCSLTNPRIFLWGRHERKGVLRQTNQAWLWCEREIQKGPQMTRKKTPSSPRTIWPPRFK